MGKEKNEPSLHALADIGNVGENGTTVTFTQTLGRGNLVGLGAGGQKVGVVALDEGEEAGDEERVGDGLNGVNATQRISIKLIRAEGILVTCLGWRSYIFKSASLRAFPKNCVLTRHRRRGIFML